MRLLGRDDKRRKPRTISCSIPWLTVVKRTNSPTIAIIFIEFCASARGLLANVEMGAAAGFDRHAMVVRFLLQAPSLQPDCQEFR